MNGGEVGRKKQPHNFILYWYESTPPAMPGFPHRFSLQRSEGVNEWGFFFTVFKQYPRLQGFCLPGSSRLTWGQSRLLPEQGGLTDEGLGGRGTRPPQGFSKTKALQGPSARLPWPLFLLKHSNYVKVNLYRNTSGINSLKHYFITESLLQNKN